MQEYYLQLEKILYKYFGKPFFESNQCIYTNLRKLKLFTKSIFTNLKT